MDFTQISPLYWSGGHAISKVEWANTQVAKLEKFASSSQLNSDEQELLDFLKGWQQAEKDPSDFGGRPYEATDKGLQERLIEIYDGVVAEVRVRSDEQRRVDEEARRNPGKFVTGTVFELVGSIVSNGKVGNHYEVAARDVKFDEWNDQGLVLGRRIIMTDSPYARDHLFYRHEGPRIPTHFFEVLRNHEAWGIFVPCNERGQYPELADVEKTLVFYMMGGENTKIENDDSGTFHYQTVVKDGFEYDALERVRY